MKKRRLFAIFSIMIVFVMIFLLSSPLFRLNDVKAVFYDEHYNEISLSHNSVFTSQNKVHKIVECGQFDFGSLIFFAPKEKYTRRIELASPYVKVLSIVSVFPNSLRLNLQERIEKLCIICDDGYCILDKEFKILRHEDSVQQDLIMLEFISENNTPISFFDFFDISSQAFTDGVFLSDSNFVFQSLSNMFDIISHMDTTIGSFIRSLSIQKDVENMVTLSIASIQPFGVTLIIEDVLSDFEYKLKKILNALSTLYFRENIKTTHGKLKINLSKNISWSE